MNTMTHLLKRSVTIYAFSGKNGFGEFSYADPVTHPARIEQKIQKVTNKDGAECVSKSFIFVETPVHTSDKIILEDGVEPFVLAVSRLDDMEGVFHHSEVYM